MTHTIYGEESFLTRTLSSLGVPDLHILRAFNDQEYRFYELSADLQDALHFSHFELPEMEKPIKLSGRIRLREKVALPDRPKIRIQEETISIKPVREPGTKPSIKLDKDSTV